MKRTFSVLLLCVLLISSSGLLPFLSGIGSVQGEVTDVAEVILDEYAAFKADDPLAELRDEIARLEASGFGDALSDVIDAVLAADRAAFLYFFAEWCHFCQQAGPIVDALAAAYPDRVIVIRIDGERNPAAMTTFDVEGYPSMFLIIGTDDGAYVSREFRGFTAEAVLAEALDAIVDIPLAQPGWDLYDEYYTYQVERSSSFDRVDDTPNELSEEHTCSASLCHQTCELMGVELVWGSTFPPYPGFPNNPTDYNTYQAITVECYDRCFNNPPRLWPHKYGHECRSGLAADLRRPFCAGRYGFWREECNNCEKTYTYVPCGSGKECRTSSSGGVVCVSTSQPTCDDDDDCTNDYGSYPNCWYTRIPGCDNPDDNVAISALTSATPPPGDALTVPTVGVLFHGFALEVLDLLDGLGYAAVPLNLSLGGLDEFPVVVIPSGGLAGLDTSPTFTAGLAAYVADGGTLLVFSQQHGDEYAALPGDALTGYGWLEDQSCHFASVAIDAYHPIHAGQTRSTLDLNVDGFFTGYPENSIVLLRRTKNGMPAMLLYEHGQGRVVASTLYSDMAASLYQDTAAEATLIRDLVAWASTGATMPSYPRGAVTITLNVTNPYAYPAHAFTPGDLVTFQVNVTNRGDVASDTVALVLSDPYFDAYTTVTQTVAATIPPNASALLDFTYQTSATSLPGIWSLTYLLYAGDDLVHAERGVQFALDYDVDDASAFTASAQVLGPDRTLVKQTSTSLTIPPGATGSFDVVLFAGDLGIYELAYAVDSAIEATVASGRHLFAVSTFTGTPGGYARQGSSFDFLVTSDDEYYLLDDNVTLAFNLWNHDAANHTVRVEWDDENRTVEVPAGGSTAFEDTAEAATFGTGRSRLHAYLYFENGTLIGQSVRVFTVVDREVTPTITTDQPTYAEGDTVHLTVTLHNPAPKGVSTTAVVTVEYQNQVLFAQNFTRTLDALASALVTTNYTLPVDAFGPYYAHVAAYPAEGCASENNDACLLGRDGTFFEVPSVVSSLHLDQPEYRARDAVTAELQLFNNMHDAWDQTVTVAVPALVLSDSSSVHLDPGSDQAATFTVTLPADLPPGPYDVTVTFVEEGETVRYEDAFYVPPSHLRFQGVIVSSGTLGLQIGNTGGVDTTYNVTYALLDLLAPSTAIAPTDRSGMVQAGETIVLTVPLPLGLVAQTYYLVLTLTDETTGASTDVTVPLFLDGVSVALVSETDRTVYTTDDLVSVLTNIAVTEAITDATLHLEILAGQPLPPKGCVVPMDDLLVTEDVVLCPGTYAINDTNQDGVIIVGADNVVIEGNHTVLLGADTFMSGWGIANDGFDNVVVRNLELRGYRRGISFQNSAYHRVENVTIDLSSAASYTDSRFIGIYLDDVHRSQLVGNNLSTNIQYGLYAISSTLNTLTGNTFYANATGMYLDTQSNGNRITTNRVVGGPYSSDTWGNRYGMTVRQSSNNTIAENDFSYLFTGVSLSDADNNTVTNNDLSGSTTGRWGGYTAYYGPSGYGMQIYSAHNNTITDNNASSHGTGFRLYGSDGNVLARNTVKFSSYHDGFDRYRGKGIDLDDSDGNVFLDNNISENYYGVYLVNSDNNTFRDTELTGNTYSFTANVLSYTTRGFDLDIDTSNLVDGKPVYYLLDAQDVTLDAASNAGVVYCIRCENLTVRDLNLSHSGAGIYLYETVNAQLLNNTLANNQYGIYLRSSTAVTMQDNAIAVTGLDPRAGIELYDAPSNEIVANTLTGTRRGYGINLDESDDLVIVDNEFAGQGNAIYLYHSESILIEGNTISNGGAIYFRANSEADVSINNTIRDNVARGITGYGLTARWLYDSLIAHNNFTDSSAGINLRDARNLVVIGNNASYNGWPSSTGYGIVVESSENIQLLNNTANTNYNTGIFLARVRNCTISGNNVTDNRSQGIRLWSAHNNTITDNVVHDNGYLTYNGEGIYLGNNYYQPYGSHNNTIANNSVRYNHRYGIWLQHSSANNTLSDNLICANTAYDVYNASSLNVGISNTCNTTSSWNDIGATNCTFTCPANGNGGMPAPPMSLCPTCAPTLSPTEHSSSQLLIKEPNGPSLVAPTPSSGVPPSLEAPSASLATASPVAYAPANGGALPEHVIWTRDIPISVADVEELTTVVGALNITGKLFLAATLRSSTGRVLAYSLFPFFVTDRDVVLTMTTDQRLYRPGDLVTITGTVENLGSAGAFSFQLQANGSTFYADTVSLDVGATHDYETQVMANATFTLEGIVNDATVTDVVRVEVPVITASLNAPAIVDHAAFPVELMIENTGNVSAELTVQLVGDTEPVVVPPHTLTVLSVETSITANTTLTATITGDVTLTLQQDVTFGVAATIVVTPEPVYVPGLVTIPYTVTSSGVLDARFTVTFTVLGDTFTREVALPAGGNLTDALLVTPPKGTHVLAYSSPFGSDVVAVNVAGDPAFTVTWLPDDLVFDLGAVAAINVTVRNTGGQMGEVELRLESPGLFDVVARAWIDAGATRNVTATVALPDDVANGTYALHVHLDDATYTTTFTMRGALIAVEGTLNRALYAPGENATLTMTVENLRDVPLDLYARVQLGNYSAIEPFAFTGLDTTQLTFAVPVTLGDGKLLFAVYMASGRSLYINSLYLNEQPPSSAGITLQTDQQVYGIGDTVTITVNVTTAGQLVVSGPNLDLNVTASPGIHVYTFEVPTLRSGVYPLEYAFGNFTASYPLDVDGYQARILASQLDQLAYTSDDPLNLTLRIDVNRAFDGVVRLAVLTPNGHVVSDAEVDHSFTVGENTVHLTAAVSTNMSGLHTVVAKVYAYGSTIFLASGARYFDATFVDDEPPSITHLPATSGVEGQAIPIAALVTDNVVVEEVALYYRLVGATSYTRLPMPPCAMCIDTYNATIPATAVNLEYYLNATDGVHVALSGSPVSPHLISVNLYPEAVTLNAPTGITHNALTLSWTASGEADFANYTVYQSTTSGTLGTAIATLTDASTTTLTVTGLAPATTYYFTVRVTDTDGLSADSAQISATTTAAPPPAEIPWLYVGLALVAVAAIAVFLLRSRLV